MSIKYKLVGIPQMTRTLQAVADAVGKDGVGTHTEQFKDILLKPAEDIRDDAQALVPVETGNLRDAIFAARGPSDRPGVVYGVSLEKAPYAPDVEYGTSRANAQPFMRPALNAARSDFPNSIAPGVADFIEGVANKNAYHPPEQK